MGVDEAGNRLGLDAELLQVIAYQPGLEHFDGCQSVQVYLRTKIDIHKATLPYQAHYAIVPQALSYTVIHKTSVLGTRPVETDERKERAAVRRECFERTLRTVRHPHGCNSVPLDKDTGRD